VYDTKTSAWYAGTSIPTAVASVGATQAADGKVYVMGGGTWADLMQVLDPTQGTWSSQTSMPEGLFNPSVIASPSGAIYVLGGAVYLASANAFWVARFIRNEYFPYIPRAATSTVPGKTSYAGSAGLIPAR